MMLTNPPYISFYDYQVAKVSGRGPGQLMSNSLPSGSCIPTA